MALPSKTPWAKRSTRLFHGGAAAVQVSRIVQAIRVEKDIGKHDPERFIRDTTKLTACVTCGKERGRSAMAPVQEGHRTVGFRCKSCPSPKKLARQMASPKKATVRRKPHAKPLRQRIDDFYNAEP